ncbi:MAG: hypothetical protein WEB00_16075 [Dehalococcoidia bacterium]
MAVSFPRMQAAGEAGSWAWLTVTECRSCWARFNALRWQRSLGHPEIEELREYLSDGFEDGRDGTLALAERWRALNPRTDQEIQGFYETAEDYLYDLALFHASGERMDYVRELINLATKHRCASALEYGCGIGSDGLELAAGGLDVQFMDYRNPSTAYLFWRLGERGLDEESLHFVGEEPIPEADLVFALDVFEHLPEPETMAEVLARKTGKVLVYNVLFRVDSDTICPMHLPGHDPVVTAEAITDRLSALGLKQIKDDPLLTVWTR